MTFPIVALAAAALGVVVASLYIGALEVDRVALRGQQQTIAQAINQNGHAFARELRLNTVWDEAYDNVVAGDTKWMDKYLGNYLNEVLGYDRVYVMSGNKELMYGSIGGEPGSKNYKLPEPIKRLADQALSETPSLPADQVVETPITLAGGLSVKHRSVVDVVSVDGQPSSVIISTIVPDHGSQKQISQKPPVLVATHDLDAADIRRIGNEFGFRDLHWARFGVPRGYDAASVHAADGDPVATLAWKQNHPGKEFLKRVAPGLLLALLPIAALAYLLSVWGGRQVKQLVDSEAHAKQAARTDMLTELPNRVALREILKRLIATAKVSGSPLTVLAVDIDRFKAINDAFGHSVGDAVLKATAHRLARLTPASGVVGRPDGDSFVILAPGRGPAEGHELGEQIVAALAQPFDLDSGTRVYVAASVGFAVAPRDGDSADEVTRRVELAVSKAKEDGETAVVGFAPDMDAEVTYRLMLEAALRAAVAEGTIDVAYQPLMDPTGNHVLGVEALARWTDEDLGPIAPDVFIPLAEETGLIQKLGELVLKRALADSRAWPDVAVAVNVSASQIHHGDVVEVVRKALADSQFPAERLEIEITESVFLTDEKRADEQMQGLKALGVRVALDDFGTGYSSLQYLRRLGFDILKIDRSFIESAGDPAGSSVVLASIIGLGQDLNLTITAEGVESEAQRLWLQASGCHQLQGYLFSRPLTAKDMAAFISAHRASAEAVAS